jgi:hypothetical protein
MLLLSRMCCASSAILELLQLLLALLPLQGCRRRCRLARLPAVETCTVAADILNLCAIAA